MINMVIVALKYPLPGTEKIIKEEKFYIAYPRCVNLIGSF